MTTRVSYMLRCKPNTDTSTTDDLRLLGIDVWCGKVLEGRPDPNRGTRKGKRELVWSERPAFPTYLFAEMSIYDFHRANEHKNIWKINRVAYSLETNLKNVQSRVDAEFRAAERARDRDEAPKPNFTPGESLEAFGGPLQGLMGPFVEIIDDAEGAHVVVEGPLGRVKVSPHDVRRVV